MTSCASPWISLFSILAQIPGQQGAPEPIPLPHPEIPLPVELPQGLPTWLIVAASVIILALVGLVIWLLFKPKPAALPPPIVPIKRALKALKDLKNQAPNLPPPETSHRVSEILRTYFLHRYGVPAPFRTSPELFENPPLTANDARGAWRERFGPLAPVYDEIAFAPVPATVAQAHSLIDLAISKLEEERA